MRSSSDVVEKYRGLADKIKDGLVVESDTITEKESHSAFYSNLPEGVTEDAVKELSKYMGKFVTAAHVAVGEMAADIFKKNKSLDKVNATVGFFAPTDAINMTIDRSKTFTNHLAKDDADKEVVKHLHFNTAVSMRSTKGVSIKSVKDTLGDEFKDFFTK